MNWEDLLPIATRTLAKLPHDWKPAVQQRIVDLQRKAIARAAFSLDDKRWLALTLFVIFDEAMPSGYLTAKEGSTIAAFASLADKTL